MATYTTRLMTLVDGYSQTKPNLSIQEKIEMARSKIFDFDYPFFDKGLKAEFERHFIRKFYMREIGFETEGLFKFQLETWLQINMPYFNKLLESETLTFNPLENVNVGITTNLKNLKDQNDVIDRTEDEVSNETGKRDIDTVSKQELDTKAKTDRTQNGTSETSENSNSTTTGKSDTTNSQDNAIDTTENNFDRNISSDTPQTRLALTTNDGSGIIEYASKIDEEKQKNVKNQNENTTGEEHQTTSGTGKVDSESNTTTSQTGVENATTDTTINTTTNVDDAHKTDQTKNKVGNQKLDSAIQVLEDYAKQEIGKTGSMTYSKMLTEYRSTFLRIEQEIFEEMQELFMMVY